MRAPISACIIVKNEPLLEKCLLSIRDHVEEIVIVDTGSTDGTTQEIAKKYADIFEVYTECNDENGLMENFAQARQRSYDLATKRFVLWLDADDIITGGENLIKITDSAVMTDDAYGIMFPYEYSYNDLGQCTCLHYRERLILNKQHFKWVNPVHEVLIPKDNVKYTLDTMDDVVWKHQRQYGTKAHEPGRNLRILRKYIAKIGDSDARQLYYLGLECFNNGLVDEAIENLVKYVDLSGWDDERAMACLKLIDIYQMKSDYESGLKWAFKTIALKETWGEGYFALGKMFYFLAQNGGPNESRHWERCSNFIKMGLNLPPTKTLLFINPLDRDYDIHRYFNMALSKMGDVAGALESTKVGLASRSDDAMLLLNKKIYEQHIAIDRMIHFANNLRDLGKIDNSAVKTIMSIINGNKLIPEKVIIEKLPIEGFDVLPADLSIDQLQSLVLMLWKQYMKADEISSAASFLEIVPSVIKNSSIVDKAKSLTRFAMNEGETKGLDIIFFIGNGLEIWSPSTFEKTGLGGSETMAIEMSKRLAALGNRVRVYSGCGDMEGVYDGVEYYLTEKYINLECDVLIVSRYTPVLSDQYNVKAKLRLLWIHDIFCIQATNELLLKADRVLALSPWHKENIINKHNISPDQVIVTRNGIDLRRFDKQVKRDQFKCINSSSPDRSWPILLELWPRIKERVPQATLTLAYGFKNWEISARHDQLAMDLINRLKAQIEALKPLGVTFIDRVDQNRLAEEFLSAGAWIYPTWFAETSCISAQSAQLAGLYTITSNIAALQTTVGSRGVLINGDWTSDEYKNKFVDSVVAALNNADENERKALQQYARDNFGLDTLADEWNKMFYDIIEEVKWNPISPYRPTVPYLAGGNGYTAGDTRIRS